MTISNYTSYHNLRDIDTVYLLKDIKCMSIQFFVVFSFGKSKKKKSVFITHKLPNMQKQNKNIQGSVLV